MERDKIVDLLASITAQFSTASPKEKKRVEALQKSLASVMLSQDLPIKDFPLSKIGKSAIHTEKIDVKNIQNIVDKAKPLKEEEQMHVELSNSNFQIDLFTQAKEKGFVGRVIPEYSGIRKLKSEGPFPGIGAIDWSIDFYPYTTKLHSIYIEGQTLPALLFKTKILKFPIELPDLPFFGNMEHIFGKDYKNLEIFRQAKEKGIQSESIKIKPERFQRKGIIKTKDIKIANQPIKIKPPIEFIPNLPKNTHLYQVTGNTVWVRANLLTPSAPNGHYCALRVKNGTVFLDKLPTSEVKNKITVNKTTTITVNLNLEQSNPETANNEKFGLDARKAEYKLPTHFGFSLKNTEKTIFSVSDIDCKVYGSASTLKYENSQNVGYNELISSVTIPVKSNKSDFTIQKCESELVEIIGKATIKNSYWTLFTHFIDIERPLEADGSGGLIFMCKNGLTINVKNTDEILSLTEPFIFLAPQVIYLIDKKSGSQGFQREVNLWKDEAKPFETTAKIKYRKESDLAYSSTGNGEETLTHFADIRLNVDRPVKANGDPVLINTKQSILMFRGKEDERGILILDFDLLKDNYIPTASNQPQPDVVEPIAFALQNALLTVTPPMIISLSGKYDEQFHHIYEAELTTYYGIFSYIPTLPDPYAANISILDNPKNRKLPFSLNRVILTMTNITTWKEDENVSTAFDFIVPSTANKKAVKKNSETGTVNEAGETPKLKFQTILNPTADNNTKVEGEAFNQTMANMNMVIKEPSKIAEIITDISVNLNSEGRFSLLDVSSNANQVGVSFKPYKQSIRRSGNDDEGQWPSPLKIDKLDVVAQGESAQAFMLPQISWEPTFNLSEQLVVGGGTLANDPPPGFNYYPNDGYPTYIGNYSKSPVALSPIPLSQFLVNVYGKEDNKITYALFNLPFGMFGISVLDKRSGQAITPTIENVSPDFKGDIKGGIQLELTAGSSFAVEGDLFQGITVQIANIQDMAGKQGNYSTLGSSVHEIFSREFSKLPTNPEDKSRPAVPLERIGLSGYGASIFSDWHNKNATFAATSQATFNVATGRAMHEVVQVKSVIYPWGIFVVRTVTILRLSSGYIMRIDSGWQAESDGKFYFGIKREGVQEPNPYEFHAGLVKGLYNIRNIRENELVFNSSTTITDQDFVFNPTTNKEEKHVGAPIYPEAILRGLTFDADIEIEGVIEGQDKKNRVPSKGVLGFVQLAPRGTAIKPNVLSDLLDFQNGSIGGPVDCTIKIAGTEQYMKINRVDVNNSVDTSYDPIFVAAARGSVILPKEGSWTMVTHKAIDGTVAPLDKDMSVPLIRIGKWDFGKLLNSGDLKNLQRIAHPIELLRVEEDTTINFGFLQNLDTQKVLFLTPSFKKGVNALLSKTPPLMADGYKLLNSKGIFPDIGDAVTNYGDAVAFIKGKVENNTVKDLFTKVNGVKDGVNDVYELLKIGVTPNTGKLVDQGYQLLKKGLDGKINKALNFDFPSGDYPLINTEHFKIIIKYSATDDSKLDYNLDSFADDLEDQWRGRLNNVSMVVSLGPFDDLMTVKGNFNNEKGKESNFGGSVSADGLPVPEIIFSDAVRPVMDILEVLEQLSVGDYAATLKKGLKVAMSNSANIWEYKYEATKEIGLIRFPAGPLYDSPQTPLKLEASLSIGFYFNAALKVTDNPKDLLPSAGAFFLFHGGLQVMCVSVAAATIYAIGNVDLKLSADTTPQLAVDMKFGFGAQLAVGLPVIGNVSIQFMISIEIHADTGNNVSVAALMMFRGHAELFGGIVGVTITIEAKGAIEKSGSGPTNCRASVSFGLDISVAFIINISFHETWEETKQIA